MRCCEHGLVELMGTWVSGGNDDMNSMTVRG